MPLLSEEDQARLLVEMPYRCPGCRKKPRRNYCRQCDEFFFVCACPVDPDNDHTGHRTY